MNDNRRRNTNAATDLQVIMDRPGDSQKPAQAPPAAVKEVPPSWRSLYLILYNFVSAVLWGAVLGRVVLIAGLYGWRNVFLGNDEFVRWVQTAAGMEVLHSLVGTYISEYWIVMEEC